MILVIGATGVLGQKVVRLLLAEGHRVRAMTRAPERAENLERQGAEIVVADLIDAASLERACRGATRVLAAAHSFFGKGTYRSDAVDDAGHRALIDAARAVGVTRFVYTSGLGAAPDHPVDFFRTKYAIEQYLRASGLDYVILRPSAFMEWHAHIFNGKSILEKGRTTLLGNGTKLRNFVAANDVAHFAVLALTAPTVVRRVLEIGGPGNFSNNEVAQIYAQFAGIEPRVSHLPRSVARTLALFSRPFQPGLSRVMRLASLPDDAFSESFDPTNLLRDYPTRLTSLHEFVRNEVARARSLEN
jgi:NADH dehydrogenase